MKIQYQTIQTKQSTHEKLHSRFYSFLNFVHCLGKIIGLEIVIHKCN